MTAIAFYRREAERHRKEAPKEQNPRAEGAITGLRTALQRPGRHRGGCQREWRPASRFCAAAAGTTATAEERGRQVGRLVGGLVGHDLLRPICRASSLKSGCLILQHRSMPSAALRRDGRSQSRASCWAERGYFEVDTRRRRQARPPLRTGTLISSRRSNAVAHWHQTHALQLARSWTRGGY